MKIQNLTALEFTSFVVAFFFWWVVNPLLYVTIGRPGDLALILITIIFAPITLWVVLLDVFKMAEPYEKRELEKKFKALRSLKLPKSDTL